MVSKEVFKRQMQRLKNLFPNWKANLSDREVIKDWYNEFKDLPEEEFVRKVDKFVADSSYPPTVAGIMNEDLKEKSKYQRASDRKVSEYDYGGLDDLWK